MPGGLFFVFTQLVSCHQFSLFVLSRYYVNQEGDMLVNVVAIISLVLGLILALWGYNLRRIVIPLINFYIGFSAAAGVVSLLSGDDFMSTTAGLVAGIVVGVFVALLSFRFSSVAVAILGGAIGYGLVVYLLLALDIENSNIVSLGGLLGGAIAALISVLNRNRKWLTIMLTSAAGAFALVIGTLLLFDQVATEDIGSGMALSSILETPLLWPLIWLVLFILGYFAQSRSAEAKTSTD